MVGGKVLYTVVSGAASTPAALYYFIAQQEPESTLEEFYNWETKEITIPYEGPVDEEMKEMLSEWQLLEREGELMDSVLLGKEDENEFTNIFGSESVCSDWVVVDDDYLFDSESSTVEEFVAEYL